MTKYIVGSRYERKKVFKPDYKIIESLVNGKKQQRLIIFDPANKELCYEYALRKKKDVFDCCGCTELRKGTRLKIYYKNTPDEYCEIYSDEHICNLRPYNGSHTVATKKILKKPNYEIQNVIFRGKKTKKLIVFDEKDKELCYELCFEKSRFICRRCIKKKQNVFAYLETDGDGNECLRLGPNPHVCSLQLYQSEKDKQEIIIDASKFKLVPDSKEGTFKICIFVGEEKQLCYEFSFSSKSYRCVGCRKNDHQFIIKLCKKDNDEYFIQMKNCQKHVCKPQKFKCDNSKNAETTEKSAKNFILYQNENGTKKMIVFPSEADKNDKKYCYDYLLDRTIFRCNKCAKLKKHVSAKIKKDAKSGEESLELGATKHVCKKLKFSTIKKSIIKELSYEDVFPAAAKDKNQKTTAKFELRPNKKNVKDAVLIVFHPTDKKLCYEFHILQSVERYRCINCEKLKARVSAKLSTDSNGKKQVIIGEKEHICKPIKYQQEETKFTNFIMLHEDDATKVPKLIVYTSESKTHCYEYRKENLHFVCNGCTGKKSYAKLLKDFDGKNYVDFCTQEHTCAPQFFDAKKYEDDPIIDSSKFELFPNSLKDPNSKLFIFNSTDRKYGYEYNFHKNDNEIFYCYQCQRYLNKGVSAKLMPKNDGSNNFDIKMSKAEHACEPQNFVETGHLYFPPNFIHQNATDTNKEMIKVIYSKDKSLCYHFEFDNDLQIYFCIACKNRNRFISGKIIKCDETECFMVGYDHKCFPMPV
uniref:Uncharacterized protein n=1 Tax=Panagrolaimus sp. ES5 TaxID=591445 RepID=A0AC34FN12_9BILA